MYGSITLPIELMVRRMGRAAANKRPSCPKWTLRHEVSRVALSLLLRPGCAGCGRELLGSSALIRHQECHTYTMDMT